MRLTALALVLFLSGCAARGSAPMAEAGTEEEGGGEAESESAMEGGSPSSEAAEPTVQAPVQPQVALQSYDELLQLDSQAEELSRMGDCANACELGSRMCELSVRICVLSSQNHGDPELSDRCSDARDRCERARQRLHRACGCSY